MTNPLRCHSCLTRKDLKPCPRCGRPYCSACITRLGTCPLDGIDLNAEPEVVVMEVEPKEVRVHRKPDRVFICRKCEAVLHVQGWPKECPNCSACSSDPRDLFIVWDFPVPVVSKRTLEDAILNREASK